jgi:hypothetical protein
MEVVARDGPLLLLADGSAGAILHPDGTVLVGMLAVLAGHGQWIEVDGEPIPAYTPDDLASRLAAKRVELGYE